TRLAVRLKSVSGAITPVEVRHVQGAAATWTRLGVHGAECPQQASQEASHQSQKASHRRPKSVIRRQKSVTAVSQFGDLLDVFAQVVTAFRPVPLAVAVGAYDDALGNLRQRLCARPAVLSNVA